MIEKKKSDLEEKIDKLNENLSKNNILEFTELLGSNKKIIFKNFLAGISRGIGIGIGVSILSAVVIYFLQRIVRLNIPIIGEYISDIAEIIENNKGNIWSYFYLLFTI